MKSIDLKDDALPEGVTKLDLSKNELTSLGTAGYGQKLTWLNASNNQIEDATALKNMTSLKVRFDCGF